MYSLNCLIFPAKVCQTFIVSGAMYNLNTNGYYDVTGHICSGRVAYERVNGSVKYYLYYGNPDDLYYGWNIGKSLSFSLFQCACACVRIYIYIYIYNIHMP